MKEGTLLITGVLFKTLNVHLISGRIQRNGLFTIIF